MTALALEPVGTVRAAFPRVPLMRVTAVELRKMFNTRSGFWLMASIVITSVLATVAVILFAPDDELTYSTFGTAVGWPIAAILPLIAVLSVTSEWSQRSGLTTFTLVPHRSRVSLAKAISSVGIGIASMLVALAVGAVGNVVGTAITGTPLIWDIAFLDVVYIVIGNVLGLLTGFMLGMLIRNSPGALAAYFVYTFLVPGLTGALEATQKSFADVRPWVDPGEAQAPLFLFDRALSAVQWAQIGVTGLVWLVIPMAIGLRLVMRSEIK